MRKWKFKGNNAERQTTIHQQRQYNLHSPLEKRSNDTTIGWYLSQYWPVSELVWHRHRVTSHLMYRKLPNAVRGLNDVMHYTAMTVGNIVYNRLWNNRLVQHLELIWEYVSLFRDDKTWALVLYTVRKVIVYYEHNVSWSLFHQMKCNKLKKNWNRYFKRKYCIYNVLLSLIKYRTRETKMNFNASVINVSRYQSESEHFRH